jgi:hypothetical protein
MSFGDQASVDLMDPEVFLASAVRAIQYGQSFSAGITLAGEHLLGWTVADGKIPFVGHRHLFEMHRPMKDTDTTLYVCVMMPPGNMDLEVIQRFFIQDGEDDFESRFNRTQACIRGPRELRRTLRFS